MNGWAASGEPAASIAHMATVLTAGSGAILLLITALALLAMRSHRHARSPRGWIIGGGVLFPGIVLIALFAWTVAQTRQQEAALASSDGELVVGVTGHQWWWALRYRDPAGGPEIEAANELHLPVGRTIHLALTSADVIHSAWLPALAGKVDLLPGRITHLRLRIERPGVYRGACAEFCGEQHARMPLLVVAHENAAFDAWLARQREEAAAATTALQQRGRALFMASGCSACHTVRSRDAARAPLLTRAPDLTHVGSRSAIAGTLPNTPAHLADWIARAQENKPGARMASYGHLDADSREALAAYLTGLK